jgi:uncharacterized protein (UPF0332 family)
LTAESVDRRHAEAAAEWEQAGRSLRSSKVLFDDGDANGSVNRLYYALFHAARAALIHEDIAIPKSHAGLIAAFGASFVRTGKIALPLGKLLNRVEHERLLADYSGDTIDSEALPGLLVQGESFLAAVRALTQGKRTANRP